MRATTVPSSAAVSAPRSPVGSRPSARGAPDPVTLALQARINKLLPGDTLTFACGRLETGLVRSVVVLLVPTGNYVWVSSARLSPETLPTNHRVDTTVTAVSAPLTTELAPPTPPTTARYAAVRSDVTPSFELPFGVPSDALVDWRTYLELRRAAGSREPIRDAQQYVLAVVGKAAPVGPNVLDFEFRVLPGLFAGQNAARWYASVRDLVVALAILDARANFVVPLEDALARAGPAAAVEALKSVRSELLAVQASVR
jgi:hypothetical protein